MRKSLQIMHFHTVKKLKGEKATLLIVLKNFKARQQNAFFSDLDLDKQSCTQGLSWIPSSVRSVGLLDIHACCSVGFVQEWLMKSFF
jgi:hypothetical protein